MGALFGKINEEVPDFTSLGKLGSLEIRQYKEQYVATVLSSDFPGAKTRDAFQGKAFRTLAAYIGVLSRPNNEKKEAISMTAPVMMTRNEVVTAETTPIDQTPSQVAKDGEKPNVDWSMTFILPSKFIKNGKEPPTPLNPAVRIMKMAPRKMAVKQFSWNLNQTSISKNLDEALEELKAQKDTKYEVLRDAQGNAAYEVFGYNSPFTLPWTKTNEVGILLRDQCAGTGAPLEKEEITKM